MIDWNVAVQAGTRLVRPGPQISHAEAREVVAELRELSKIAHGHVRDFTGMAIEADPEPATIVDRPGWIRANVDGFRVVLEPLLEQMEARRGPGLLGGGPGGVMVQAVGSRVTGMQVGVILSYMASRVLGQYELFLPPDPSGRAPTGRLTLVAPNIVHVEQDLEVDPHDFRLWVCLHEETHRAQFTGVPWLREYVQDQMTKFLLASDLDPGALMDRLRDAADVLADAVRGGEGNLIDAIQTPEQRVILDRLTAVMTLAEGHGDYVMDAVGPEVVPSVQQIRSRFQGRREGGSRLDKAVRRLLGIDLKMKQYAEGSRFVRQVVTEVGMADFNKVWRSPETLPTLPEIKEPALWIDRVVGPRHLDAPPEPGIGPGREPGAATGTDGAGA
ncbi:zinc-dependent metalloprotease [Spirillospora sp. CA-253888]